MRIGIDVGGTNTDAAALEDGRVLAWHKSPTSRDVTEGITSALAGVLQETSRGPDAVSAVMIGTTHFVNALTERLRLLEVAVVRLALPATSAVLPMPDWPPALRRSIGDHVYLAHGGYNFDGREISPLDLQELKRIAEDIRRAGVRSLAISSVFSPVNRDMEVRAAEFFARACPGVWISLSSDVGRIGLLERENATILNAALRDIASSVVRSLRAALGHMGISAPFFVTQNDGTLMQADFAEAHPILTFASGPTNSMRGAAFLSDIRDGIIVDIGGTTTDVGVLVNGYPREAPSTVDVAGVRTNFRMPDVLSIGLGGGSLVEGDGRAGATLGPESVGYRLVEDALVFGGTTLTTTDLAVAGGRARVGDPSAVAHLDPALVATGLREAGRMIAEAVDRVKVSADPVPVVLVGGGAILAGEAIDGASSVTRPEGSAVANAIGAAIAHVGGEVDKVFSLDGTSRHVALQTATEEAVRRAVEAGAAAATVEVVDVEETTLSYLPGNATRIRVKAVGDLPSTSATRPRR
jgi:N-methylhydantoinase A/oxoprolinase/acetone carboxylase beta subunit